MTDRILLVQLADRGDLILTTPALHALRETCPDAHLTLLASSHSAPLVEGAGLVDEIVTLDRQAFNHSLAFLNPGNLRRLFGMGKYDTVVFFHQFTLNLGTPKFWLIARAARAKRRIGLQNGSGWFLTESVPDEGFGAQHQAQYWLALVGLLGADSAPRPARIRVGTYDLPGTGDGPRIVIHAGGGGYSLARRWEPEKFAGVADQLHNELGAQIMLVGGPDDDANTVEAFMQHRPINLSGQTTMDELASVIQQADLYIGTDSGVTHIAAAVGTPVVAIYGPSNNAAWGPWTSGTKSVTIRSGVECSPCNYIRHGIGLREGCPARTCMKLVETAQVVSAAKSILSGEAPDLTVEPPPTQTSERAWSRINILGLPVDGITYTQWLDLIGEWVREGQRAHHVCTTNPEFTMIAQHDPNFANILRRSDLCVPDGVGMLWAARRLGTRLPQRVTGSDGVGIIAERAAQDGWKLFFLGAASGIADQAAEILRERHPGLQIVGTYSGSPAPEEEDEIVQRVNTSGADILFVAYGAPNQDKWIARNLPRLGVKMAMGVGGAFDFIVGIIPRAPLWMRRAGLEWLYRLYREPRRIKRQMRLPRFVLAVLFQRRQDRTES